MTRSLTTRPIPFFWESWAYESMMVNFMDEIDSCEEDITVELQILDLLTCGWGEMFPELGWGARASLIDPNLQMDCAEPEFDLMNDFPWAITEQ